MPSTPADRLAEALESLLELRENLLHTKFTLAPDDAPLALLYLESALVGIQQALDDLANELSRHCGGA